MKRNPAPWAALIAMASFSMIVGILLVLWLAARLV
jgi:hypothetical protein